MGGSEIPYIAQPDRDLLDPWIEEILRRIDGPGSLNYTITKLLLSYAHRKPGGANYARWNEVMGILACCGQELYRRHVGPYEEEKILLNGDVTA